MRSLVICLIYLIQIFVVPELAMAKSGPLELLAAGKFDAARASLHESVTGSSSALYDFAFLESLILIKRGKTRAAVLSLRAILNEAPSYEPARRELVFLLDRQGQVEAAVYHAERLIGTTADRRLARDLSRFIASRQLRKNKGVSLRFALLPSSNFNQGTSANTILVGGLNFDIDENSRAKSGIGVSFGATAWRRWQMQGGWDATAQTSLDFKTYPNRDVADQTTFSAQLSFGRTTQRSRLTFGPIMELSLQSDTVTRKRLGLATGVTYRPQPKRLYYANAQFFRQTFPAQPFRDGSFLRLNAGATFYLRSNVVASFTLPIERERTNRPHLDHTQFGVTMSVDKDWLGGLTTGLTLGYSKDRYRGVYPGSTAARRDIAKSVGLRVKHRKLALGNFTPELSYVYTRNASNVAFFDYDTHDVGLTFSKQF